MAQTKYALFKKLSLLGDGVKVSQWGLVKALVSGIKDGSVVVVKAEYYDDFRRAHPEIYPLNLSEIKTWSTFEECVEVELTAGLHLTDFPVNLSVRIYEGDWDGKRKGLKFTAELKASMGILNEIPYFIHSAFRGLLENLWAKAEDERRLAWMDAKQKELLGK